MRTLIVVLFQFLGLGVLLFVGGTFWGAAFAGPRSSDLVGSLATGDTHTWIATILMTLGAGSFACAPFFAALVWLRGRRLRVRPEHSGRFPDDPDGLVLKQLVTAGSDLSKAHQPEFFLYFSDEITAERIAALIEADGFQVSVQHAASSGNWLCLATRTMLLTHDGMAAIRTRFNVLADENHGEYDGWGTPVVS